MDNHADHGAPSQDPELPDSRGQLLWAVLVFQFKLAMDGLRDVILVPISLLAGLVGMLWGNDPSRFFRGVIRFGRRTEAWINLFGHHQSSATADDMIKPIQTRVFTHAEQNPTLKRAGKSINRSLDQFSHSLQTKAQDLGPKNRPSPGSAPGPGKDNPGQPSPDKTIQPPE